MHGEGQRLIVVHEVQAHQVKERRLRVAASGRHRARSDAGLTTRREGVRAHWTHSAIGALTWSTPKVSVINAFPRRSTTSLDNVTRPPENVN